jgi:hypothetical protein
MAVGLLHREQGSTERRSLTADTINLTCGGLEIGMTWVRSRTLVIARVRSAQAP